MRFKKDELVIFTPWRHLKESLHPIRFIGRVIRFYTTHNELKYEVEVLGVNIKVQGVFNEELDPFPFPEKLEQVLEFGPLERQAAWALVDSMNDTV